MALIHLTDDKKNENAYFALGNYFIQLSRGKMNENSDHDHYELIVADNSDGNKKRMAVLTAESVDGELVEMDCSGMRENVIIDLNREGRRWEGGEWNGKPFGFGCEYSENDNLVYEGFVFEGMKVCFGKEWNDNGNNNCLVYEGGYCNGKRWGKGKSYNLTGNVDFEGEWMNNHGMTKSLEDLMNDLIVPMSIERFVINNEMFNDKNITTLHFSPLLVRLRIIRIGESCFEYVQRFIIDGLPNLTSINVDYYSFRRYDEELENGLCQISHCPNLREIYFDEFCFEFHQSFELSNVNSLQFISFGFSCFRSSDLLLKGTELFIFIPFFILDLPSLELACFENNSFQACHIAIFESISTIFLYYCRSS